MRISDWSSDVCSSDLSIEVTSYAELVLAPQSGDSAHPAFSKMFVRTEWLFERRCLVGTRRVRSPGDPSACAAQWLDVEGGGDEPQRETDRARFIGRGHDQRDPVALAGELSGTVGDRKSTRLNSSH